MSANRQLLDRHIAMAKSVRNFIYFSLLLLMWRALLVLTEREIFYSVVLQIWRRPGFFF